MTLLFVAALAVSFFFTGIESGILAVNPVRLRHQARLRSGGEKAARLASLLERPGRLLLTCALLTNFANTVAVLAVFNLAMRALGPAGAPLGLILAVPFWTIVLGVIPKALFRRFPLRALGSFVDLLDLLTRLLSPFLLLFERLFAPLLAARAERSRGSWESREEIKFLTDQSHRAGALTDLEKRMIHGVIDFRDRHARDLMIPWGKVTALHGQATLAEAAAVARTTGLDRLPVILSNKKAEPIGLLVVADMLLDPAVAGKTIKDFIRRIVVCEEDDSAFKVVREMRAARATLAVVCSGENRPVGIVTSEDLVAEMLQAGTGSEIK